MTMTGREYDLVHNRVYVGQDRCLHIFVPPTVRINPPVLPTTRGPAYGLFRHYEVTLAGVNVYLLSDLTYCQNYETPENANTNIPYPWDPYYRPQGPFSRVVNWDGTIQEFFMDPWIVKPYWGSHRNVVTCDEGDALVAAGYGAYLTDATVAESQLMANRHSFEYEGMELFEP
jgi:hypothetical protein